MLVFKISASQTANRCTVSGELAERKHTQFPADRVILERNEEKQPIEQHPPHSNISADPRGNGVRPNHDSAVEEHCYERETQRPSHHGIMDEKGHLEVLEVERGQVEQVQYEDDLRDPEMGVHPQEDECRLQEVVEDEVGADVGGGVDYFGVEGG